MHEPKDYRCPFCRIWNDSEEREAEVLFESTHSIGFLGLRGHEHSGPTVIIASKVHYENLYDLPPEVIADAFTMAQRVAKILKRGLFSGWHDNMAT